MRSNALKKQPYETAPESWEEFRLRVAQQAEEASTLPGNQNDTDIEEFVTRYRLKQTNFA